MRFLGIISAIFFAFLFLSTGTVQAETMHPKQQLHTSGRVVASQSIVVDGQGIVTQIFSNSTEEVIPKVYLLTISPQSRLELTPEILAQYRKHVPLGKARVGVLYQKSILESSLVPHDNLTTLLEPANPSRNVALSVNL